MELETSASGNDLKVPLLCLLDRQVDATGSFQFATRLSARGNDPESLFRSLEGPVELTARDGRIYRWTLLSKILAVLNVTNVVRGKFPDFGGEGLPYTTARFHGEQKGKVLLLKDGTLNGPTIGIAASGSIDLGTSQADVKMLVAPFRTADWIIRKIPLVRYVMKKTLVSVPFTVKGDYRDPTVSFDPVGVGRVSSGPGPDPPAPGEDPGGCLPESGDAEVKRRENPPLQNRAILKGAIATPLHRDILKISLPHWRRIMRRRILLAGIAPVFFVLVAIAIHARAQDEPFPVALRVGETFEACSSGQIVCPARTPICDDPEGRRSGGYERGAWGFWASVAERPSARRPPR